jgi:hypothetical protein
MVRIQKIKKLKKGVDKSPKVWYNKDTKEREVNKK